MASERKPFDHWPVCYMTIGGIWGALMATDFAWRAVIEPAAIFAVVWLWEWAWHRWQLAARIVGACRAFAHPSTEAPHP